MKKLLLLALIAASTVTHAGVYSDDLARCLITSTSSADRSELARWMFTVFSVHPAVAPSARADASTMDAANRRTAKLFNRLLTQDCLQQTRNARRYEGNPAIANSFKALGEVAAQELMTHPAVNSALSGFANHIDAKRLDELTLK